MQGHIRKRTHKTKDGRTTVNWYVVIELERDADGKRRQKWYGGYRTRKEAEAARIEILHQINTGTFVEPTKTTLEEWALRTWLPLIADRVKPSTLDSYRLNLELHVLPTLGRRQVRRLTPAMLNQLYTELLTTGNIKTGGGLSAKTVNYVHTIIHKVLADAVDLGLLTINVADRAKPPRPKARESKEIKSWSADELRRFLRLIEGHRLEAAWHVAAFTGMRRAEILGLRWRDVDLDSSRLAVRQTLVSVGYEIVKSTPKTHQARTIDLDAGTIERLCGTTEIASTESVRSGAATTKRTTWCSARRTVHQSIPTPSRKPSNESSPARAYQGSPCTACGTPTPRWGSLLVSPRRWSPSVSVMRTSRSR
ncbi:MAG TPA: hypothetical protein ENG98_00790 [Actinobacteria bacterium]|nr:phage integrase family protein [bacterium BMS3Bbin01]HDL41532.1 hypothetical protein [Actinomycetota bacterium]